MPITTTFEDPVGRRLVNALPFPRYDPQSTRKPPSNLRFAVALEHCEYLAALGTEQ